MTDHVIAVFPDRRVAEVAAEAMQSHGLPPADLDAPSDLDWVAERVGHRAEDAIRRYGPVAGPEAAAVNRTVFAGLAGFAIGAALSAAMGADMTLMLVIGLAASSVFWLGGLIVVSHQLTQRELVMMHRRQAASVGVDVDSWVGRIKARYFAGSYGARIVLVRRTPGVVRGQRGRPV